MRKFRNDINILRAIAVSIVVFYHFNIYGFSGGFIGVDIFFVISGYLMTSILVSSESLDDYIGFFKARSIRIIPALLVLILCVSTLGFFLVDPLQHQKLLKESIFAATFVSNIFYAKSINYFNPDSGSMWLLHTWSLSAEWQFYVLYPFYLYICKRTLGASRLFYSILALSAVSLLICVLPIVSNNNYIFYLLPFRAWEMAAGGIVYFLHLRKEQATAASVLSFAAILYCVVTFDSETPWPSLWTLVPVVATSIIISSNLDIRRSFLHIPFEQIGLSSYSIYLWHWPILVYMNYLQVLDSRIAVISGILLSITFGLISYHLIERPLQRTLKLWRFSTIAAAATVCASFIAILPLLHMLILRDMGSLYGIETARWRSYIDASLDRQDESACAGLNSRGDLKPCVFSTGAAGGTRVLVIGDSHAQMWLPRLEKLPGSQIDPNLSSVTLTAYHGCPALPGINRGFRQCATYNNKAFELAASGGFDRVLIINYWDYFSTLGELCFVKNETCKADTSNKSIGEAFSEFLEEIKKLSSENISINIMLPPVISDFNTPVELARRNFLQIETDDVSFLKRDRQEFKRKHVMEFLSSLKSIRGVTLIDPFEIMCDTTNCRTVDIQGAPILRDTNHLRTSFTETSTLLDRYLR